MSVQELIEALQRLPDKSVPAFGKVTCVLNGHEITREGEIQSINTRQYDYERRKVRLEAKEG